MTTKPYEVHLEMFEGPLDLLLFLIKKNDLDIYDIPISQITQEYLTCLDLMKELNLEVAGEFLVTASTLMQIKARTLLPSRPDEEEQGPDPRAELVAKLLEYQRFKEAAKFLDQKGEEFKGVFFRGCPRFGEDEKSLSIPIFDLLSTLREILDRAEGGEMTLAGEEFPIAEKMEKILALLESSPFVTFRDLFRSEHKRRGILTCFLALLELIKLQRVFARQDGLFGEIRLYKKEPPQVPVKAIWPGAEDAQAAAEPRAQEPGPEARQPGPAAEQEPGPAAEPVPDEGPAEAA